ncbi:MAG: hypothetical protein GY841_09435, partial [FCB group bacterium]|nr:hypothetical protein [FCB group bacterium]
NKSVSYTYKPGGRLKTRTWARGSGSIVTTYKYDPNTAELLNINYTDATPGIGFTYDRLGRQETITDAVGTRTFNYSPETLDLNYVSITQDASFSGSGLYNRTVTRKYDTYGRSTGFYMGTDYDVTYGYENKTGRFKSVSHNTAGSQKTATYYYVPKSNLIQRLEIGSGVTNDIVTTYLYEPERNLKTIVKNESPGITSPLISQYKYTYDDIGRRTFVENTGTAFSQDAFSKYGYNNRSELIGSNRYLGTDTTNTSMPVDPETRIYTYDNIGNRKTAIEHTLLNTYNTNKLNQYDHTTDGQIKNPAYDDDGNMTDYSGRKYTYNAENRLIAVEPETPAAGDKKVKFVYDYMGRRVKKTVFVWNTSWT